MKEYVSNVIEKMKQEKLFAPQGGPIILAQVLIFTTRDHFMLYI